MDVNVTALIENRSANPELAFEFGLSLLVEAGGRRILFDAGSSGAFADNAARLGVNLEGVDAAVLSHGHYDHCLGLCRLVEAGGLKAGEELYLLSGFRRACRFEPMDPADLVFTGSGFRVDDYRDELALVVRGETGLAVFTGCAHSGLVNICTHAEALLGLPVLAYVGGTHLAPSPLTRAERTAEYVNASSIRTLAACHCTGPSAMELFARACPAYTPFSTGDRLTLTV